MAPLPKFQLVFVVVLTSVFVASNAEQPPPARTLHLPVFFRHHPDAIELASVDGNPPPLRSVVQSGVTHDSGGYFAALGVGTPATREFLILDTGSDFTWIQCAPCRRCYPQMTQLYDPRRSTSYARVPFSSPRCRDELQIPVRDARTGACLYVVVYADASSSRGEVAAETLAFSDGRDVIRNVTIGCGRDNEGLLSAAAGVLGVGRGVLSFPSQLAEAGYGRVFSYCLGDREARASSSSSFLVFGRAPAPPAMAFTPLRTSPRNPSHYVVDMLGFSVDGTRVVITGAAAAGLALDAKTGRGGVVVDSGATVSRFARAAYAALRDAFDARAAATGTLRNVRRNMSVYDTCYELRRGTARVPAVALHFAGGADMVLPTRNYMIPVEDLESGRTVYCFGFIGFEPSEDEHNTLGNVQQQGFQILFDEERKRIGFAPNGC